MKKIWRRWDYIILIAFGLMALTAPFLAGNKPIACVCSTGVALPLLEAPGGQQWLQLQACTKGWQWLPLIGYAPGDIDREHRGESPATAQQPNAWRYQHWLGTDDLGRDVAAGMIHGSTVALITGVLAVFIAFIIGVFAGMIAAYSRYTKPRIGLFQLVSGMLGGVLIWFYGISSWSVYGEVLLFKCLSFGLLMAWLGVCARLPFYPKWLGSFPLPLDELLVKILEIRKSIPGLLLIMALSTVITSPSVWILAGVIALLSWTDFARLARTETLAALQENYIKSLQMLGIPSRTILLKHILPNSLPTLGVAACFSIAGAILLESSLSFLGLGLPADQVSWGKMLAEGRNMQQWWLVVFPGIALFLLVLALNKSADRFQGRRRQTGL
jgi:peptide/nickel transport system permease protein